MRCALLNKPTSWPWVVGAGVFAVALWAQTSALVGVFYDDGIYVVLAKALAEGEGYRNIHLPGAPPAVHYPVLYPAALSALWHMWPSFPANVALFQVFDAAMLGLAGALIAAHASRARVSVPAQAVAFVVGFTAFPLLALVGVRFAEPLFLALIAGAVLLADRDGVDGRHAIAAGALAGLATLARSIGLVAIAGVAAALWWRGRRREAAAAAIAGAAFVLPWILWTASHGDAIDPRIALNYGTYASPLGDAGLAAVAAGLRLTGLGPLPRLFLPAWPAPVWLVLAALMIAPIVWGGVRAFRRMPALVVTLLLYLLIVTLWPYTPDRFIWIVLPWLLMFGAVGCADLWRRGRPAQVAVAVLVLVMTVGYARREVLSLRERGFAATAEGISGSFRLFLPSLTQELPPDAVVALEDEALVYLYTGRRAVPNYLFELSGRQSVAFAPDTFVAFYCDMGVTHVGVTGSRAPAAPILDTVRSRHPAAMRPAFTLPLGRALYEFTCPR